MSKYLISVIIPTRNRQTYAEAAIRQILSLDKSIEIIINDNSNDDSLAKQIDDIINRDDVVYTFINGRISAVDNYNSAAQRARGEYFIAIGDDDGLLPNIEDCALWMKNNNIDAVKPSKNIRYWWPDLSDNNPVIKRGFLSVGSFSDKCYFADPENGILKLLKQGGQDYLSLDLVGSYHGLIKMTRMKEVYKITGRFYGGCSPDMYSTTCLSLLPNMRFAVIGYPISIPGICAKSTSADSGKGRHVGALQDAPQFVGMKEKYLWDERVPALYSVETIWAECFHKAIIAMGREALLEQFDYSQLYQKIYRNNESIREELLELIDDKEAENIVKHNKIKSFSSRIKRMNYIASRITSRVLNKRLRLTPCKDIYCAEKAVVAFLLNRKMEIGWKTILSSEYKNG